MNPPTLFFSKLLIKSAPTAAIQPTSIRISYASREHGVLGSDKQQRMGGNPRPDTFIVSRLRVAYVDSARKYYFDVVEQRYYQWDSLHGEFEVFDRRGFHLGSVCPATGLVLKPPARGRRIKPN